MKRSTTIMILILLLSVGISLTRAQSTTTPIAYGDTVTGEITNANFEDLYTFEASAGDIISIAMVRGSDEGLDGYLYLTTIDNEQVAFNDDYSNTNPRIVTRIPADGTYQIVATRYGERTGSSEGSYSLTLETVQVGQLDVTLEGKAVEGQAAPIHVFAPETAGVYTVSYRHIEGEYFPTVSIYEISSDEFSGGYPSEVGSIDGQKVYGGSIAIEMSPDAIYVFSIDPSWYYYGDVSGMSATYTVRVLPSE